jgi:hypothetical protein
MIETTSPKSPVNGTDNHTKRKDKVVKDWEINTPLSHRQNEIILMLQNNVAERLVPSQVSGSHFLF